MAPVPFAALAAAVTLRGLWFSPGREGLGIGGEGDPGPSVALWPIWAGPVSHMC